HNRRASGQNPLRRGQRRRIESETYPAGGANLLPQRRVECGRRLADRIVLTEIATAAQEPVEERHAVSSLRRAARACRSTPRLRDGASPSRQALRAVDCLRTTDFGPG